MLKKQEHIPAGQDSVLPFTIEDMNIKGRIVHLNASIHSILERHDYPEPVNYLLAQMMALTVLLGTSLKFQGKFILQTHSDGPVNMLVCDFCTPNALRAYARFDPALVEKHVKEGHKNVESLLGKGTLALTIDQGADMQRYQGIVALDGSDLETIAKTYFMQSEQIPTDVRLNAGKVYNKDAKGGVQEQWHAGGLLVQLLPDASKKATPLHEGDHEDDHEPLSQEESWRETTALMKTVEDSELIDPLVPVETLLYRLFHEHKTRIFSATKIIDQCSCSYEKSKEILSSFSPKELEESVEDGKISMQCAFCSSRYQFDRKELAAAKTPPASKSQQEEPKEDRKEESSH